MMYHETMKQIAIKISDAAHERLQRLAHQGKTTYAVIIENALKAHHFSETSASTSEIHDVQALINAAIAPVLERLEAIESVRQIDDLGGSKAQGIAEPGSAARGN